MSRAKAVLKRHSIDFTSMRVDQILVRAGDLDPASVADDGETHHNDFRS